MVIGQRMILKYISSMIGDSLPKTDPKCVNDSTPVIYYVERQRACFADFQ